MAMLDVLGNPTWFDVRGDGDETVLLLHGGLSSSDAILDGLGAELVRHRRVAAFDRRGHGRTADTPEPFHYESMVDETIAIIEHLGGPVHVIGWSDGGIVGLLLAMRRPELVDRLVTIGANYHWNAAEDVDAVPAGELLDAASVEQMLANDPVMAMMAAEYGERSPDGPDHFATVVAKGIHLFGSEPEITPEQLSEIATPVLVMAGDDDIIPISHTAKLFAALPNAQLAIVPGASHGLPLEQPQEVAVIVERFLAAELPPKTLMPHARA